LIVPTPSCSKEQIQVALAAVKQHGSKVKAAASLGWTRGKLDNTLRAGIKQSIFAPTPDVASEVAKLQDEVTELRAQLKNAKGNTLDATYVRRKIFGLVEESTHTRIPQWLVDPVRGKALPGVPVAMWSDWHWGEVVFPDQVNGVNEFNLEVAHARAKRLLERTVRLLKNHVVNPDYPGIVLCLGGDMLSGDIHEELKESNDVPLLPALLDIYGVLCASIKVLADTFGKVFVPCVTGNHGRMSRKPQAKNRNFTNYDWLLYQLLAKHFANDPRISFYIPDGPDALFSVLGHKILLTHGDQFRGGDGMIGAIGPITRGNQKKLARNSAVNREYDTMMIGHWHQYMPLHRTLVNGSLKGYDEYANSNNFGFEPPIQAMFLVHPEHGIIMHLPVYLEPHPGKQEGAPWIQWQDKA